MNDAPRQTIKEIYIGIGIYGALFMILGLIFVKPRWIYAIALIVGLILAMVLTYSIFLSLDKALDMSSDKARSHATTHSILRLVAEMIIMIIAIMIDWAAFVGVVVGMLGLKVSAYFNPLLKSFFNKKLETKLEAKHDQND